MTDAFTIHHLRFTCEVETAIEMDVFKGSALRGAWQSHLRTLYCAQSDGADALHQSLCPVCFLLSRETGSGDDRRPYAFEPPLSTRTRFEPGDRFAFGISLFGQTVQFLPYLVLAVGQMGHHQGIGRFLHNGKRGTFRLISIEERNPLTGERRTLLPEGGQMVQMPTLPVTAEQVNEASRILAERLKDGRAQLTLHFLTPTRIIAEGRLVHRPHFAPFFARLLDRVTALRCQFAGSVPLSPHEKYDLLSQADRVELVCDETEWWDVQGRSARLQRRQPLGGFVGRAVYRCEEDWSPLLPWLLWGQSTQVGKNTVKGAGWYVVESATGGNRRGSEEANE